MDEVDYKWSGQVMEPVDGLGFIGKDPAREKNIYIATGDSGMGMTNGTIAGILLTDLIAGRKNPWSEIYDPSRKEFHAAVEYARENLNVAAQYVQHGQPGEVNSIDEIEPGHQARGPGAAVGRSEFGDPGRRSS